MQTVPKVWKHFHSWIICTICKENWIHSGNSFISVVYLNTNGRDVIILFIHYLFPFLLFDNNLNRQFKKILTFISERNYLILVMLDYR